MVDPRSFFLSRGSLAFLPVGLLTFPSVSKPHHQVQNTPKHLGTVLFLGEHHADPEATWVNVLHSKLCLNPACVSSEGELESF